MVLLRRRAAVAVGVVVVAGASFLGGRVLASDPVVDDLGERCDDTVPVNAAKTFLETDHMAVTREEPPAETWAVECRIAPVVTDSEADAEASIGVVIAPVDGAEDHLLSESVEDTVPFGAGWVGSYGLNPDSSGAGVGTATLLVDCADQPGGGLMVIVSGSWDDEDPDLREQKYAQLGVVAARLAQNAGRAQGCDERTGDVPQSVTVLEGGPTSTPVGEAAGTCEGILSEDLARELRAGQVTEWPAGRALTEQCEIHTTGPPYETYRLSANYSAAATFAQDEPWAEEYSEVATATCPGAQRQGWYSAMAGGHGNEEPEDPEALDEAFEAFVAESAARHGCTVDPIAQPLPDDENATNLGPAERYERLDGPAPETASPDPDATAPREWEQALPATADTVAAILPDPRAMEGTRFVDQSEEPETGTGPEAYVCAAIEALCQSLQAYGDVEYTTADEHWALEFQTLAYDSAQSAQDALNAVEAYYADSHDWLNLGPAIEPGDEDLGYDVGDDALGFHDYTTVVNGGNPRALLEVIREGPYLGLVWQGVDEEVGDEWVNLDIQTSLYDLITQRMGQAKRGDRPDAVASGWLLEQP
ncbi:hypothetical protein [Streptomyces sp. B6B3]|uniref:hypothetical protein n=1 Tax=Streptomyces sp. B6B3 TaxID=3153570 RepID=UPI00325CF142